MFYVPKKLIMMRAILIDDEVNALDTLEIELKAYCPEVTVIKKCAGAKEGLAAIRKHNPDIIFLDIEMPWMSGFELLGQLGAFSLDVIFVTAYSEFAIKAFEVNAVDYLLKPISKIKLIDAVQKAKDRRPVTDDVLRNIMTTLDANRTARPLPHIALPTPEGLEFVKIDDIIYASADSNYSNIHLKDGNTILLAKTLKQVEALVEGRNFLRIHQSYLVNLAFIKKYIKGQGGTLVMESGVSLPVSRSCKESLMSLIR